MGKEDPNKPDEIFRSGIKQIVAATNKALGGLEEVKEKAREVWKPVGSTLESLQAHASTAADSAKQTYERRHEYPVEIIGGSALLGGGTMWLRRGRIAGVIGATALGGAAYAVVYDEIKWEELPEMVFGKKGN